MNQDSSKLSRRDFLRTAAIAGGTLAAAGMLSGCTDSVVTQLPEKWDEEVDVVVVGGGGAGCAAAYGAANAGAKVIVLQSQLTSANSSTAICGGFIMFADTQEQRDAGITDTAAQMAQDIIDWGETSVPEVVQTFADQNLVYYDLIKSLGVPFQPNVSASPGSTIPRSLTVNPAEHQKIIEQAAKDKGAVFKYETTGQKLIVNPAGEVVGTTAVNSNGSTLYLKANKAVIMASGGFTHNFDMLEECVPGLGAVQALSGPGHTGEGHKAIFQLGGSFSGRPWIYSVQGMYPGATTMAGYAELFLYGAIQVNLDGERYIAEDLYWCNEMTASTLQQPLVDGIPVLYEVIDQTAYDLAVTAGPPIGLGETTIEMLVSAPTIEELGTKINAPKLAETVHRYNADIDAVGYDQQFGRKTMVGTGTPVVTKIEKGPFYAFANTAWLAYDPATSFKINKDCYAVDQYDQPIPRLFLVGEVSLRSIVGNHYQYGLATGAGGVLGLYAGGLAAGLGAWK